MKFLVDNALSPLVAKELRAMGHDAIHVLDVHIASAPDAIILDRARVERRVLMSADTDFGSLLALSSAGGPSVVLFRKGAQRSTKAVLAVLKDHLGNLAPKLESGAIVVFEPDRYRIRPLPIRRSPAS